MQKQKKESDEITEKGVSKKGLQSGDTNKRKIKLKIINLKKGADWSIFFLKSTSQFVSFRKS